MSSVICNKEDRPMTNFGELLMRGINWQADCCDDASCSSNGVGKHRHIGLDDPPIDAAGPKSQLLSLHHCGHGSFRRRYSGRL